jgi:hypothetical protein
MWCRRKEISPEIIGLLLERNVIHRKSYGYDKRSYHSVYPL